MKKNIQIIVLASVIVVFVLALYGKSQKVIEQMNEQKQEEQNIGEKGTLYAGIFQAIQENVFDAGIIDPGLHVVTLTPDQQAAGVYTFLQGPRSFEEMRPWSGEWCQVVVNRNSFGGFGCGHCCMANIYSSLSPYECSPLDIYEYATQVTNYYPTRESGAIGWRDMKRTLKAAGFQSRLHVKPDTYEKFQRHISESKSAIVLVCSGNDDTFWKDTGGHYVNIWLYQPDSDMVFLAEPGDPENNRGWIPLRYVYDALKTSSHYQYLSILDYVEEDNQWKWNGIDEVWNGKQ